MTTERLEEFRVLANMLNYSKAAEKLFLSQSILSRHIKELEAELGCTLFLRDTHGVSLTDDGKYFLKWVEPFLGKTERTIAAISDEHTGSEGRVRLICAEQTLNTHVLSFIRGFMADYPHIDLDFSPIATTAKKELLYAADLLLTPCDFTGLLLKDAEGCYLCTQEPLLAIPPYHHFGDKQEILLEDLKGEELIVPFMDELFGSYARNATVANRKCHGTLRRMNAETSEAALLMVELGKGVMLIPHHLKHRVYPHTRTIPVADPDCSFPIYIYLNRGTGNPAAQLFYEKIQEEFQKK